MLIRTVKRTLQDRNINKNRKKEAKRHIIQ